MLRKKILVVEDEPLIALNIQVELEKEGYEVIIDCFNVSQALQLIEKENPNLVIIDIHLNDETSGIELGQILLEKNERPFMFLTSYLDRMTLEKVRNTRPYGYLVKPFNPENLIATIFVILSNFEHRHIDVDRLDQPIKNELPFHIKMVMNRINKQIGEKINISNLAEMTPWEAEHFGRIFKELVGLSPYQFILKRRVEISQSLLAETDDSIIQISNQVGFSTYSNFYKAFKKITNITPEQYRSIEKAKKMFGAK
ncbi:helix-turn-helix domain-containing protein [Aquirufa sp. ROCK2-A2]